MSISIKNVSKFYGEQTALHSVSLNIKKGEVVGFLGPNGAGKSTLMKIITCYLSANEGEVKVCGLDVQKDSLSVRSKVGYLPEHNPMYLENVYQRIFRICSRCLQLSKTAYFRND